MPVKRHHRPLRSCRELRTGAAWLELLLVLAAGVLLLQLWPTLGNGILWAIDVRNWSREVWFGANFGLILVLLSLRFAPGLYADWKERQGLLAVKQAKADKQRQLKEQREALERAAQSRRRRIY